MWLDEEGWRVSASSQELTARQGATSSAFSYMSGINYRNVCTWRPPAGATAFEEGSWVRMFAQEAP